MADERSPSLITGFIFSSDVPPKSCSNVKGPHVNTPARRRAPHTLSPLVQKNTPQSTKLQKNRGRAVKGSGSTGKKGEHVVKHAEETTDIKADILGKAPYEEQVKPGPLTHPEGKSCAVTFEKKSTSEDDDKKKPENDGITASYPTSTAAKIVNAVKYLFSPSQDKSADKKETVAAKETSSPSVVNQTSSPVAVNQINVPTLQKDTLGSSRLLKMAVLQSINSKLLSVKTDVATAEAIELESKSKIGGASKLVHQVSLGNKDATVDRRTVHVNITEERSQKPSAKLAQTNVNQTSPSAKELAPTQKAGNDNSVAPRRSAVPRIGSTSSARNRANSQGRNSQAATGAKDDSCSPKIMQPQIRKRSSKVTTATGSLVTSRGVSSAKEQESKVESIDIHGSSSSKAPSKVSNKPSSANKTQNDDSKVDASKQAQAATQQKQGSKAKAVVNSPKLETHPSNPVPDTKKRGLAKGQPANSGNDEVHGIAQPDSGKQHMQKSSVDKPKTNGNQMKRGNVKQISSNNRDSEDIKKSTTRNPSNLTPSRAVSNKTSRNVTPQLQAKSVIGKPKPEAAFSEKQNSESHSVQSNKDQNISEAASCPQPEQRSFSSEFAHMEENERIVNDVIQDSLACRGVFGPGLNLDDMVERSHISVYFKTLEEINDEMDYSLGDLEALRALSSKLESLLFRLTWIQRRATAAIVTLKTHQAEQLRKGKQNK